MLPSKRTALVALSQGCLMTQISLALMLYFSMVADKATCQTLLKAFLKSMKTRQRSCWCWKYFSQRILRLKICSMVLLPALKPSYSSAMIFSAYTFILFSIFSMTLLGWLMWLIVRQFWHFWWLPFLESVMTKDQVHKVGHSLVCQILLLIVMRAVITSSPHAWTSSAGMLSTPANFPFINYCTAASISLGRMRWSSSVSAWGQFSINGFPLAL